MIHDKGEILRQLEILQKLRTELEENKMLKDSEESGALSRMFRFLRKNR